jgi:hypothetical protein
MASMLTGIVLLVVLGLGAIAAAALLIGLFRVCGRRPDGRAPNG